MKRGIFSIILMAFFVALFAGSALAGRVYNEYPYHHDDLTVTTLVATNVTASTEQCTSLPLGSFLSETGGAGATVGTTGVQLTSSTAPALLIDSTGDFEYLSWADGEEDPIYLNHSVPRDYSSSSYYKVTAHQPLTGVLESIDFDVRVNAEVGTAWDSTVTDQTPVDITGVNEPATVTLTPTTDFASLAAGDMVRLRLWRNNAAGTGTQNLEITAIKFCTTDTQ